MAILGKLQEHELIFKGTQGLEVKLKKIEAFKGKESPPMLKIFVLMVGCRNPSQVLMKLGV